MPIISFSVEIFRPSVFRLIGKKTTEITKLDRGNIVDLKGNCKNPFRIIIKDPNHVQNVTGSIENGTTWPGQYVKDLPYFLSFLILTRTERLLGVKKRLRYTPSPEA